MMSLNKSTCNAVVGTESKYLISFVRIWPFSVKYEQTYGLKGKIHIHSLFYIFLVVGVISN